MAKPTEGPYTFEAEEDDAAFSFCIRSAPTVDQGFKARVRWTIAYVTRISPKATSEEIEATARLLAKSWEMRRVLQKIIDGLPQNRDWLDPMLEQEARDLLIDGDSQ